MSIPESQYHRLTSGTAEIAPQGALLSRLESGASLRVKLGVDPTAPDLHLGHAVPLRKLLQFQRAGHKVVLIIGDFTALIGDPSGRSTIRPPLSKEEVDAHAETYLAQVFKILDPELTEVRRNSEWLACLDFGDLLRLSSMFTVARILERDDFQKRYREGVGISLHELLYPLAQAYDSVVVKADIEIGGTDQLFNLLAGRELMERHGMQPQVCMTLPLLEGTDGVQKMSKSYGNYVGLTDEPADMFGKIMSIPDELMVKYYCLCSSIPAEEIDTIEEGLRTGELHPGQTKRALARDIVDIYHGGSAGTDAEAAFDRVFKEHSIPEDVPEVVVELGEVVHLPALLKELGLVASNAEGRRMIDQAGVKVDGISLAPGIYDCPVGDIDGRVIQVGRRRFARPRRS